MIAVVSAAGGLLVGLALAALLVRVRQQRALATPRARRIAFPFLGSALADPALDAAIRLAAAEHALLVAVHLVVVPRQIRLDAPLPEHCERAIPLLEAIEQRARRSGVAIDARIETGRSVRHALSRFLAYADYDRIVAPAGAASFGAGDIAWLLDHTTSEVVVLRPSLSPPISPPPAVVDELAARRA